MQFAEAKLGRVFISRLHYGDRLHKLWNRKKGVFAGDFAINLEYKPGPRHCRQTRDSSRVL